MITLIDTYLYQTPEGKLDPRLVTKVEVSQDGLTTTPHLRQGVKFSDGTPFNAKAVKLSFDRTLDPKLRVPLRFAITCVKECVVVDDSKVQLNVSTREAMLRAGQIDICYKPSPANVVALKADPKIKVDMPLDTRTIFMALRGDRPAMKDKRVRQAFNYAVDKKAIVKKILFDTAQPMDGAVSPILFGYSRLEQNTEKRKALLAKASKIFSSAPLNCQRTTLVFAGAKDDRTTPNRKLSRSIARLPGYR